MACSESWKVLGPEQAQRFHYGVSGEGKGHMQAAVGKVILSMSFAKHGQNYFKDNWIFGVFSSNQVGLGPCQGHCEHIGGYIILPDVAPQF